MTTLERDCFKYRCWCSFFGYDPKEAKSLKAYFKLRGTCISRSTGNACKRKHKRI